MTFLAHALIIVDVRRSQCRNTYFYAVSVKKPSKLQLRIICWKCDFSVD